MSLNAGKIVIGGIVVVGAAAALAFHQRDTIREWFEPWQVAVCERIIVASLKAPATYRRVEVFHNAPGTVAISFDAANSYGTLLRGIGKCSLPEKYNDILSTRLITAEIDGDAVDLSDIVVGAVGYWNDHH
jgi:hypothetical protein